MFGAYVRQSAKGGHCESITGFAGEKKGRTNAPVG